MLISGPNAFVFAACSKNASTTIEGLLAPCCDVALTRAGAARKKHVTVKDIREKFAPLFEATVPFDDYFSFGVIRDPVKRAVAKYNYRSTFKPDHKQYCGDIEFEQFLDEMCGGKAPPRSRVNSQAKFFGLQGTNIGVDFLLRLEHLVADAAPLGDRLGIDLAKALAAAHRNKNEVKRINVRDLTEEQVERIETRFSRDKKLYRIVSRRHDRGWGEVLDKPKPAISSEALRDALASTTPKLAAESLLNQLRLDKSLGEEERAAIGERIVALDPDKKIRAKLLKHAPLAKT